MSWKGYLEMKNEKRLIDANEPINAFKRYAKTHPNATWNAYGIEAVISAAKTVDAVEVVRCKDCWKWYPYNGGGSHDCSYCGYPEPDFYCGEGERRDADVR